MSVRKSNHEFADQYQAHSCLGLLKNKPQINADERRFIDLNIQHLSEVYPINGLPKSPQCTQSSTIAVVTCEMAAQSRLRTRIAGIFTDLCAMQEKTVAFYYALINKSNTIFNQKSDLNDRHFLLQRA